MSRSATRIEPLRVDDRLVGALRRALLALAGAGVAVTAVELAMLRHWGSFTRNIPWAVLAITAAAIVGVAVRPSRPMFVTARITAAVVTASTAYGIVQHVIANHDAGPLDARYADRWDSMSAWSQWWAAATESVGPSPPLAPAALALGGVCLWLATIGWTLRPSAVTRRGATSQRGGVGAGGPWPPSGPYR